MSYTPVTDAAIFSALRNQIPGGSLTQLIVDITNAAIRDDAFRAELATRLNVIADNGGREYDIALANLQKVSSNVNAAAIPSILKHAPTYGIITKKQMGAFIATCIIESNSFNAKRESFNYRASRLREVFSTRIKSVEFAQELLNKGQVAVANYLYGGRYGNRPGTNDGWDYRGGGLIQNTFRDNYYELQHDTGIAFGDNPKLIEDMEKSVVAAMSYWQSRGINDMAEKINFYSNGYTLNTLTSKGVETNDYKLNYGARLVRKAVNGGYNGFDEFCATLEKVMRYI